MTTLLDDIQKFGTLSYEAGVHEREPDFVEVADAAKECFQRIVRKIGTIKTTDVPCPLCTDAHENMRNYCWNCGRKLAYSR